mmetsp:Transcript_38273/g.91999  ORF Transcript_38273/g.91999 Transcript_38273/m.91999 type:complete len:261 (-) Transcript_38273:286-1068(-)
MHFLTRSRSFFILLRKAVATVSWGGAGKARSISLAPASLRIRAQREIFSSSSGFSFFRAASAPSTPGISTAFFTEANMSSSVMLSMYAVLCSSKILDCHSSSCTLIFACRSSSAACFLASTAAFAASCCFLLFSSSFNRSSSAFCAAFSASFLALSSAFFTAAASLAASLALFFSASASRLAFSAAFSAAFLAAITACSSLRFASAMRSSSSRLRRAALASSVSSSLISCSSCPVVVETSSSGSGLIGVNPFASRASCST